MKNKQFIYFLLLISGALLMAFGERYITKEYALALGIIILMFGVYKLSTSWKNTTEETKN